MAVFTSITAQQVEGFLAGYDCGRLKSFEGIQAGVENSNFHVFTDRGRLILTIFEKRTKPENLPFIFAYMDHLNAHGVACPRALRDKSGQTVGQLAGKPAALVTFLEGEQVAREAIDGVICRELGIAVGKAHRAADNFKETRLNALSLDGWRALIAKIDDKGEAVEPGLTRMLQEELRFLEGQWPSNLPHGAVHADIFPDNVFFKDNRFYGFIDFYFSCTDLYGYDLALVVNAWCFDTNDRWNADRFAALMDGYQSVRNLSAAECAALTVLCRGAALRILLTRLHDWVFHDPKDFVVPKDPGEYIRKLKFHQRERVL